MSSKLDPLLTASAGSRAIYTVVVTTYRPSDAFPGHMARLRTLLQPQATLLIVDDGSPPAYRPVFEAIERQGITILYHSENLGLPAARNTGFRTASTEFVIPLDDDDSIEPDFIPRTLEAITTNPCAAFAYTWVRVRGKENFIWETPRWDLVELLQRNICNPCTLIRRSCWEAVDGYSEDLREGLEDWDLWLKFAECGWYGVLVPEPLFIYNRRSGSMLDRLVSTGRLWQVQQVLIARHRSLYEMHLPSVVSSLSQRAFRAGQHARLTRENLAYWRGRLLEKLSPHGQIIADRFPVRLKIPRSERIVFLVNRFSRGELERVVELNVAALRQAGHQVSLVAHQLDQRDSPGRFIRLSRTSPGWIPFLLRHRPAVIIANDFSPVQYLSRLFGIPWVQVLQNCYTWVKPHNVTLVRRLLENASAIWPISERVRDYTAHIYGIPSERMRVIPNPLQVTLPPDPDAARQDIRAQYDIGSDARLLLFVGRLDPAKGLIHLIEALAHVRRTEPAVMLAIVGEGDLGYRLRLEHRIKQLGLEAQVQLVPWQTKVEDWYAAADVFVLPSMFEGACVAATEALVCGLHCVLTRVGDAEDLAKTTRAVTLLDPPQGTYLDIHPQNYNWCLTAEFPDFSRQLAEAIETTLENLREIRVQARDNSVQLQALRAPENIISQMLDAITEI